jgi:hypothetical protein
MSIIKCLECQAEISSTALACPKCGAVVPKTKVWPWVVGVPVGLVALILVWSGSKPDYEHKANAAREICDQRYDTLKPDCNREHYRAIKEGERAAETSAQRAKREERESAVKAYHQAEIDKQKAVYDKEQEKIKKRVASECAPLLDEKKARYKALFASGKHWEAATALRACASASDDAGLKKMVSDAELRSYVTDIESPKISAMQKLQAINQMARDFPEQAKKYEALEKKLRQ